MKMKDKTIKDNGPGTLRILRNSLNSLTDKFMLRARTMRLQKFRHEIFGLSLWQRKNKIFDADLIFWRSLFEEKMLRTVVNG